jgi:glycopeptide antibiotics resistance protein
MFYFYIIVVLVINLVPLGNQALNTMKFGPFRMDYLLHTALFLPWMSLFFFREIAAHENGRSEIRIRKWILWIILGTVLSLGVEISQYWVPKRSFNPMDALFNALGVAVGAVLSWTALYIYRFQRTTSQELKK